LRIGAESRATLRRSLIEGSVATLAAGASTLARAAGNPSEALAIIDASAEIDLPLTDVMMRGSINGRQLAVEALHRRPRLKIL
jgi:CheY-like chemotaxis protein